MNLEQTIAELEAQAARYTEAADTLRALLEKEDSVELPVARAATKATAKTAPAAKRRGRKKGSKRGPVSEETRRKIADALRAKHAERKAQKD